MPVVARLLYENHLIDACILIGFQVCAELVRRTNPAPSGVIGQLVLYRLELLPHVGDARAMVAEDANVTQRVAKEAEAVETTADRLRFVLVAGHAGHKR